MLLTQRIPGTRSRMAIAMASMVLAWSSLEAQKTGPSDVAERVSGTWKLNRDLSDSLSAPGRGGRRGGGAMFALAAPIQRGGRGGADAPASSADLTPEELDA